MCVSVGKRLDLFTHLSIIIGVFAVITLIASFSTFFLYLYKPLFMPSEAVFLINPAINYELLNRAGDIIDVRQHEIEKELETIYPDPFE